MRIRIAYKSCGKSPSAVNINGSHVSVNYKGITFCDRCSLPLKIGGGIYRKVFWHITEGEFHSRIGGFFSSYEIIALNHLNYLSKRGNIKDLRQQYSIPGHNKKSYDFYFFRNGQKYLLEIDGEQHFEDGHFGRTAIQQKNRDVRYTNLAKELGYKIIRIDYSQVSNIGYHLESSFNQSSINCYFSSPYKYLHMRV